MACRMASKCLLPTWKLESKHVLVCVCVCSRLRAMCVCVFMSACRVFMECLLCVFGGACHVCSRVRAVCVCVCVFGERAGPGEGPHAPSIVMFGLCGL
jgi:hypothetical protein